MAELNEKIQEQKDNFLFADDNSTACIMLVEKACVQYQKLFQKTNVPFSYVEFFVEEFTKYQSLFGEKLKEFFSNYTSLQLTAEDLVLRYTKSYYSQSIDIESTPEEKFLVFGNYINSNFSDSMKEVTTTSVSSFVNNLLNICKKIDMQDELMNPAELYERFMIKKAVLTSPYVQKILAKGKKKPANAEVVEEVAKTLVGNQIDDKYQTGKITKVVIPKLNLPTAYPINLDESRLITSRKAKSVSSASKQIIFINKNKIVNIKYSSDFVEKRKKKPKANKSFNWDF